MVQEADHGVITNRGLTQPERAEADAAAYETPVEGEFVVDLRSQRPIVLPRPRSSWQVGLKRTIDLVVSLLALALLSPILIATALAIKIGSPGPVLFRQIRSGQFGEEFGFLKFRSMHVDAEVRRKELEDLNHHDSGPIFKVRNDPRITPVGRFIRKYSIDELPQLAHVLSGKMSLVGPRPPLPSEVQEYGPREHRRLMVKPGITCIWQVSGRSELNFDTWVDLDIEYIENWSLGLDIKLLAQTIPAVISSRGAY